MKHILWRGIEVLLAIVVVVFLADWGVLRIKVTRGTGYGTVQVDQFLSTALKGNKEQYDYVGTFPETCAHSIFPHGAPPCWWLSRHTSHWE
jgi:hypothetical protein